MNNKIKLRSRYGDIHTLVPMPEIGENTYKYTPAEDWMCLRYIFHGKFDPNADEFDLTAVDTEGGPFLSTGDVVEGMKIKRIYDKKGVGALIEF